VGRQILACALALLLPEIVGGQAATPIPADQPVERTDRNSQVAHEQLVAKAKSGGIDVYFVGDSIVRRWGATDYPLLLAQWRQSFSGWNAANFGWGADATQNILWRLTHGELDGVQPRVIVLLAGTNNVGRSMPPEGEAARADDISRGLTAIVEVLRLKAPRATIILTAIFPRNDNIAVMPIIDRVNRALAALADGRSIRYLSINDRLADPGGRLHPGMMDPDGLHPAIRGYQVWADALTPLFTELLGPRASTDHAPAPTGNPGL
jgi:lysophospholipase L1-like esterase